MRSEQAKSSRSSRDAPKKRSSTSAPISLEDLMDKEVMSSSQDDSPSLSINSSRLIGARVLDRFFGASRLDPEDFACSLRMMLSEGRCKKVKEGVKIFNFFC